MSMRTRYRRFGSLQTMRVAMARQFTCGAESANQRFNLEFDPVSPIDGARMTVRVGLLLRLALGAAVAAFAGAGAGAQTPGQDEMNIVDQPGYQPTPEEEQLTGPYEKQEVFFRTTEAPGTVILATQGRCSTSCRATTGRFATASASAVTVSHGRACRRFRASRNGRTGARRRK